MFKNTVRWRIAKRIRADYFIPVIRSPVDTYVIKYVVPIKYIILSTRHSRLHFKFLNHNSINSSNNVIGYTGYSVLLYSL